MSGETGRGVSLSYLAPRYVRLQWVLVAVAVVHRGVMVEQVQWTDHAKLGADLEELREIRCAQA